MSGQKIFNWKLAFSAIALTAGAFGTSIIPAEAIPANRDGFKLAQVGVRSRINPPTPLNLKPQTHIPLPTNSRSYRHQSGGYSRYPRHDEYGYGHHHGDSHHHSHHRRRDRRGTVIIINPSNSSYRSYSRKSSYIRINNN